MSQRRADVEILSTGRVTANSPAEELLSMKAAEMVGLPVRRDIAPSTGGDDFAFMIQDRPGAYVWVGNGPIQPEGELHNARYDFNDDILPAAAGWMASVARLALIEPAPTQTS